MHRLTIAVVFAVLAGTAGTAVASDSTAGESAYTKLDMSSCEPVSDRFGIDGRCEGYGGVSVLVGRIPGKPWVEYGRGDDIATAFENTATVGDVIEWRLDPDGSPYAAIVRYSVDALEGWHRAADVLVIHRIFDNGQSSCLLAAIDASTTEQANGFARGVSASVSQYEACGKGHFIAVGHSDSPVHHLLSFE